MRPDYYRVLGVSRSASTEEIQTAWRALARAHHPDRTRSGAGASEGHMALLNEAWATLGDREARRAYDGLFSPEPPGVKRAILASAIQSLAAAGWASLHSRGTEFIMARGKIRIGLRAATDCDPARFREWLLRVVRSGARREDCEVLMVCRVQDSGSTEASLRNVPTHAVVIELIGSRLYGRLPEPLVAEWFAPLIDSGPEDGRRVV